MCDEYIVTIQCDEHQGKQTGSIETRKHGETLFMLRCVSLSSWEVCKENKNSVVAFSPFHPQNIIGICNQEGVKNPEREEAWEGYWQKREASY